MNQFGITQNSPKFSNGCILKCIVHRPAVGIPFHFETIWNPMLEINITVHPWSCSQSQLPHKTITTETLLIWSRLTWASIWNNNHLIRINKTPQKTLMNDHVDVGGGFTNCYCMQACTYFRAVCREATWQSGKRRKTTKIAMSSSSGNCGKNDETITRLSETPDIIEGAFWCWWILWLCGFWSRGKFPN